MKHSTKVMVTLLAIPALSVGTSAVAAHAETGSASSIVDASLSSLGVSISDPTLLAELEAEIQSAIDSGVVDPTVDPLADPAVEPTEEPTSEPTTEPTAEPTEEPTTEPTTEPTAEPSVEPTEPAHDDNGLHLGHLHDQFKLWNMASPVWNAAFEAIRVDFETCVAGADPSVDCSAQTLVALQLAHADVLSSSYDALAADIAALPVEQQPFAQAYLDRQLERAEKRLTRALEEYATNPDGTPVTLTPEILAEINDEIDRINGHSHGNGHNSGPGNGRGNGRDDDDVNSEDSSDDSRNDENDPTPFITPLPTNSDDSQDEVEDEDDTAENPSGNGGRNGGNSGNSGHRGSHGDD